VFIGLAADLQLSGGIADHLWPKAHGAGYVVTHVVVGGVLGAIGAVVVAAGVTLASVVRGHRLQP
jgi:hypothetical protein